MEKHKYGLDIGKIMTNLRIETDACKLLQEILEHQVANLGVPESEFYRCYTYSHGRMPDWVDKAKEIMEQNKI